MSVTVCNWEAFATWAMEHCLSPQAIVDALSRADEDRKKLALSKEIMRKWHDDEINYEEAFDKLHYLLSQ